MRSDLAVLRLALAAFILAVINRGICFDRRMGAIRVFGGVYFVLMGIGILPRLRRRPTAIPYSVLGAFMFLQDVALGVFHARF
jgi:hypothetical protein